MNELIVVGISDYKISKTNILATYALGSCVGTSIYDMKSGLGGLSHIMLPDSAINVSAENLNRMKFADTALVDMVEHLIKQGAVKGNMKAKIAGGANMFDIQGSNNSFGNIGARNVESVKESLEKLGIPIIGEDTGSNYGRTVFFKPDTGIVTVKSIGKKIIEL